MAVYHDEIKKISEKIFKKIIQYSKMNFNYQHKEYSFLDLIVLNMIYQEDANLTINQWIEELQVKPSECKASLNKLISFKTIERKKNINDHRQTFLLITEKGKKVMDSFYFSEEEFLEFVLKDMTVNEEKAILKFLSKLNQLTVYKHNKNNPLK